MITWRSRLAARLACIALWLHAAPAAAGTLADLPRLFKDAHYRFFPVPIVATDPAEGQTYGLLPVVTANDAQDNVISIMAAALQYNSIIQFNGFGIWILTPSADEELRLFGGAATKFYREASIDYVNSGLINHRLRVEAHGLYIEDPFERFFGFGPDRPKDAESNFTSLLGRIWGEVAFEIAPHVALVGQLDWARLGLQPRAIDALADTVTTYGALPEVADSHQISYRAGLRWDSRDSTFFPTRGALVSLLGTISHQLTGPDTPFGGVELRSKAAWQPQRRVTLVGNLWFQQLLGDQIPFFHQSHLGGERNLRGFISRRFTDHGAALLELEARVLIKEWRIFDTPVSFSIDPFCGAGQVFHRLRDIAPHHFEPAGGVGFRMRAPPSVLGRIDVGYTRDGVAVYTTLDYPF
ncbi:MAG: BamA/TamA family outer membrane protein [Deltaproteobacteria bacterium]|nr:BamA/TamA family outer membrane protein [Deltaproteobacteria bacterium]